MTASLHQLFPDSAPYIREGSRAERRAIATLAANDDAAERDPSVVAGLACVVTLGLLAVGLGAVAFGAVQFALWALGQVAP